MSAYLNASYRLGHPLPNRIVIVRSLPGLGDLLCVVPALRALRTALPDAQITWIGLQQTAYFFDRFRHYLDRWLEFPGYPGIPEVPLAPATLVAFLAEVQQQSFDLALQLHGSGVYSHGFTQLLGAKQTAGFIPPGQPGLDHLGLPYPEHEPEIWRSLRLLEFLGIPLQGDYLEFPIWPADRQAFDAIAQIYSLHTNPYICIHPGASTGARCWPTHAFATVADGLAAYGFQVVLTGTASELELTQAVAQMMEFPAINLAGQTSLGAIAVLLQQAQLLICNDTGVSHLATALQVPSVVVFSNSDPRRWAPLNRQRHRVVTGSTGQDGQPPLGRSTIPTPAAVLAQAHDLLQQEVAYAS